MKFKFLCLCLLNFAIAVDVENAGTNDRGKIGSSYVYG